MTRVAGVDAALGGWLAVVLEDGRFAAAMLARDFGTLRDELAQTDAVAVDIPIGLPDRGRRRADVAARAFVGPRRASVFFVPVGAVLAADTYGAARQIDPSLSAQAWALRRAIGDVASHGGARVYEAHPEVSFRALAGRTLAFGKRTWNGHVERRELLRAAGIELPDRFDGGRAGADDVLDAAVLGWTATRIAQREDDRLPPDAASGEPVIRY